jgi:poly-gamma-glutamate synthesis protein (capsule biosynthesis protein)
VLQSYETYKGKLIFYSLGNFVFDQNFSDATKNSAVYRVKVNTKDILSVNAYPIVIAENGKPSFQLVPSPTALPKKKIAY